MKCLDCEKQFTQDKNDLMPARRCPDCRVRILLSFRNERNLHKRKCDLCEQDFIGTYPEDSPYKVYCSKCWWSDKWDPYEHARDYDLSRSFLEQFKKLYQEIPHLGMNVTDSVNSDYTNFASKNKDCYLVVNAAWNENLYYCERMFHSKDCVDCNGLNNCQLNYWCTSCRDSYNMKYCEYCEGCTDCDFCYDCKGCQNCFGCFGLRNKKYVYFNEQLTEKEYKQAVLFFVETKHVSSLQKTKQRAHTHWLKYPHRYANVLMSENVAGDNVTRSKNCDYIFDADEMEYCRHCYVGFKAKESQYCVPADETEKCYNNMSLWQSYNVNCSSTCWFGSDIYYSFNCMSSNYLFGCAGLQKARYCILNKKYKEKEYNKTKQQIVKQLKQDDLYGEYFPVEFSPFPYHETIAQEHYPRKDIQVEHYEGATTLSRLPICKLCNKNFKIIKQEQELYKRLNIIEPENCPNCRYKERFKQRNPRQLYKRKCMNGNCGKKIMSSYNLKRPEIIYCQQCYQKSVV